MKQERLSRPPVKISSMGEGGILFDFTAVPDTSIQRRIWVAAQHLRRLAAIREIIPGVGNLLALFDPLASGRDEIEAIVADAWRDAGGVAAPGTLHRIPVTYGGEAGQDLDAVANALGLSRDEVVRRHAANQYLVAALGAHPGYPYLMGLDPSLSIPRRDNPRLFVPAGSVMIAGEMSGIATCTSSSGWHVLGRSSLSFFDPQARPPARLAPGDRVLFEVEQVLS